MQVIDDPHEGCRMSGHGFSFHYYVIVGGNGICRLHTLVSLLHSYLPTLKVHMEHRINQHACTVI